MGLSSIRQLAKSRYLKKIGHFKGPMYNILHMDLVPVRLLACLIGKIISLGLAVGPISRFMTYSLYALPESTSAWYDRLSMSTEAHASLNFGILYC